MGVDISAIRGLRKSEYEFDEDHVPIDPSTGEAFDWHNIPLDLHYIVPNDDFFDHAPEIVEGGYHVSHNNSPTVSMSYGGYNERREILAQIVGWPKMEYKYYDGKVRERHSVSAQLSDDKHAPFQVLINFSDCEGVIGHDYCVRIANDFAKFQDAADNAFPDDGFNYFKRFYNEMREVFEYAAQDDGIVIFS